MLCFKYGNMSLLLGALGATAGRGGLRDSIHRAPLPPTPLGDALLQKLATDCWGL